MAYRMYRSLVLPLSAAALLLATGETIAASGAMPHASFASPRPIFRPHVARVFPRHRRNFVGAFLPPFADDFYGAPNGEPTPYVTPPPVSGDMHYTYTYDVPWDWAHRYPPTVVPSDRQYVPSCTVEAVPVLGNDGAPRTVNVTRCY